MSKLLTVSDLTELIMKNNGVVECEDYIIYKNDIRHLDCELRNFSINKIIFKGKIKFYANPKHLFRLFLNLHFLDVECWDVSDLHDFSNMFEFLPIVEIKCSSWNTLHCKDMSFMFYKCSNLEKIDLSNWNTSRCKTTQSMFSECVSLHNLNLYNWNVTHVERFVNMFKGTNLEKIDFSKWQINTYSDYYNIFKFIY